MIPQPQLSTIEVLSQDLLSVQFNEQMVNDDALQDVNNYVITPFDNLDFAVTVDEVRPGADPTTDIVYLYISKFTIGVWYTLQLTADNLSSSTEETLNPSYSSARFFGRRTKIDNAIKTPTKMYNVQPKSIVREVLNAVGQEDDLIGGGKTNFRDLIR